MDYETLRKRMVQEQLIPRGIKDPRVLNAFYKIERHKFIPESLRNTAYADFPLPIGESQTISQPYIVALMTECLNVTPEDKVLEIGTGSGYHAALISEIVSSGNAPGHVYSIEIVPELVEIARQNLVDAGYSERVTVIQGDGFQGYAEKSPYDRIFSTAFAPKVPKPLIDQLKIDGILVIMLQGMTPLGKLETLCVVKKVQDQKIQIEYKKL